MRLLIAEDDSTNALRLTRVLTKAGHDGVPALDGLVGGLEQHSHGL